MEELVLVIPKNNLDVRDPETKQILKAEGELKVKNSYWIRRSLANEVQLQAPEKTNNLVIKNKKE